MCLDVHTPVYVGCIAWKDLYKSAVGVDSILVGGFGARQNRDNCFNPSRIGASQLCQRSQNMSDVFLTIFGYEKNVSRDQHFDRELGYIFSCIHCVTHGERDKRVDRYSLMHILCHSRVAWQAFKSELILVLILCHSWAHVTCISAGVCYFMHIHIVSLIAHVTNMSIGVYSFHAYNYCVTHSERVCGCILPRGSFFVDISWTSYNNNNNNNNEFNARFVFIWRHRGRPFHAIMLFCRNEAMWDMHGREESIVSA